MKAFISVLILSMVVALALACASGSDIAKSQSSGFRSNRTVDGAVIPYEIDNSFKAIPGGNLSNIGVAHLDIYGNDDNAALDRALLSSDYVQSERISGFQMMDSEVTVGMYVKFLNNVQGLIDKFTGTNNSFTFSSPRALYRNAMYLDSYCGIIMKKNSVTETVQASPGELAGFYIIQKPTYEKSQENINKTDPFKVYQKGRMAGENTELVTFEAIANRENYPMCFVSQSDSKEFCAWLGINYRLPTVYEWMYAAKGGNPNADFGTSTGEIHNKDANGNRIPGNYLGTIQGYATENIRTKDVVNTPTIPNGYGLRDMAGSVYEWTYFIEEDQQSAGATLPNGGFRYIMGGSYGTTNFSGAALWNKGRIRYSEGVFAADLGFRVLYSSNRAQSIAGQELAPNDF